MFQHNQCSYVVEINIAYLLYIIYCNALLGLGLGLGAVFGRCFGTNGPRSGIPFGIPRSRASFQFSTVSSVSVQQKGSCMGMNAHLVLLLLRHFRAHSTISSIGGDLSLLV